MKRLYILIPEPDLAPRVLTTLTAAGVDVDTARVVADEADTAGGVPVANATLDEMTDVSNSQVRAILGGSATAAAATLGLSVVPGLGLALSPGILALGTALGASFGLFIGTVVGVAETHPVVSEFQARLEAGEVLLVVDVDDALSDEIAFRVGQSHDDIEVRNRDVLGVNALA